MAKKKLPATAAEAAVKGKLVEFIVASLHRAPGVEVKVDVRLDARRQRSDSRRRRRQIDGLITANVSGYKVHIAIECKNYKKVIGVGHIGEFIDRLNDVGLPVQQSIYVTTQRFTQDAIERADEVGMKLLLLTGLTADRMAAEIFAAVQSVVFLLPEIVKTQIEIDEESPKKAFTSGSLAPPKCICTEDGEIIDEWLYHAIWLAWRQGEISPIIGQIPVKFDLPGCFINSGTELTPVRSVTFAVHVVGFVAIMIGNFSEHTLRSAVGNQVERHQINLDFPMNGPNLELVQFYDEEALHNAINRRNELVRVSTRICLPRIWSDAFFWPFSKRTRQIVGEQTRKFHSGEISSPHFATESEVEGMSLNSVWEPIDSDYLSNFGNSSPFVIIDTSIREP